MFDIRRVSRMLTLRSIDTMSNIKLTSPRCELAAYTGGVLKYAYLSKAWFKVKLVINTLNFVLP